MAAGSNTAEARASRDATDWLIRLQDEPHDLELHQRFDLARGRSATAPGPDPLRPDSCDHPLAYASSGCRSSEATRGGKRIVHVARCRGQSYRNRLVIL